MTDVYLALADQLGCSRAEAKEALWIWLYSGGTQKLKRTAAETAAMQSASYALAEKAVMEKARK